MTQVELYKLLNKNELKVLVAIVNDSMDCTLGDFGYFDDAYSLVKDEFTINQFKGYVGSLIKKNIICTYETDNGYIQTLANDQFESLLFVDKILK